MPWTAERYPSSMKRLAPPVRAKAIEIANALLGEGCDEGKAIRIAIAKAKQWSGDRGVSAPATGSRWRHIAGAGR